MSSAAHNLEPKIVQAGLEVVPRPDVPWHKRKITKATAAILALATASGISAKIASQRSTDVTKQPAVVIVPPVKPALVETAPKTPATKEVVYPVGNDPKAVLDNLLLNFSNVMDTNRFKPEQAQAYLKHLVVNPDSEVAQKWINDLVTQGGGTYVFVGDILPNGTNFTNPDQRTITFVLKQYQDGAYISSDVNQWSLEPRTIYVQTSSGISQEKEWLISYVQDLGPVTPDQTQPTP